MHGVASYAEEVKALSEKGAVSQHYFNNLQLLIEDIIYDWVLLHEKRGLKVILANMFVDASSWHRYVQCVETRQERAARPIQIVIR